MYFVLIPYCITEILKECQRGNFSTWQCMDTLLDTAMNAGLARNKLRNEVMDKAVVGVQVVAHTKDYTHHSEFEVVVSKSNRVQSDMASIVSDRVCCHITVFLRFAFDFSCTEVSVVQYLLFS